MENNEFIRYLCNLAQRENKAALAHLRRGLGKEPGACPEMYPYVAPWVSPKMSTGQQNGYYIVASLFALHPEHSDKIESMGNTMRLLSQKSDSTERRFVAMLNSHRDEIASHLRHAISLAKSENIPVNYEKLLQHLNHWDHPDRWVQRKWASDFWQDAGNTERKADKNQPSVDEEETN